MALGLLSNQLLERKQESPGFSLPHSKQKFVGVIGHDGVHQKKKKIVGEGALSSKTLMSDEPLEYTYQAISINCECVESGLEN